MVDVAAAQGYEAVLVDNWWDKQIGRKRIEELSKYAKSKKVSLMLWYNSNGFENDAPQTPRQIMNNSIARKKEMAWMKKLAGCATVGVRLAQECTNCMGGYQVYCRLSYQVCGGGSQVERREWFRCSAYSRQMVRGRSECYRQASRSNLGFADVCG